MAQAHYLQVTDAHFAQAVAEPQHGQEQAAKQAAQKEAQYPAGSGGNGQELVSETNEKGPVLPSLTDHNSLIHNEKRSRQESNNPSIPEGKPQIPETGGAKCGAVAARNGFASPPPDPELQTIVEAWPSLPSAIRTGIAAMVKAAKGAGDNQRE